MSNQLMTDALQLKKLIREVEALSDETLIACARLKQSMIAARQNPGIEVSTGQAALMRLSQAEAQAMAMSTNLLRVHDELSKVAREKMAKDVGVPTVINEAEVRDVETA